MGLSNRIFLLDTSDNLYCVASVLFEQMLCEPTSHRMTLFAGARVRMAHVLVECRQRQPTQVVWATFSLLTFDAAGVLNSAAYMHQQSARAESALAPGLAARNTSATVVDAASRFIDHGGRWQPTSKVAQLLEQAALGRLKCPRLLLVSLPGGEGANPGSSLRPTNPSGSGGPRPAFLTAANRLPSSPIDLRNLLTPDLSSCLTGMRGSILHATAPRPHRPKP